MYAFDYNFIPEHVGEKLSTAHDLPFNMFFFLPRGAP